MYIAYVYQYLYIIYAYNTMFYKYLTIYICNIYNIYYTIHIIL